VKTIHGVTGILSPTLQIATAPMAIILPSFNAAAASSGNPYFLDTFPAWS